MPEPRKPAWRPGAGVAPDLGAAPNVASAPPGGATRAAEDGANTNGQPFAAMGQHLFELFEFATHWATARMDQIRGGVRRILVLVAAAFVGGILALLALGAALLYLLEGAALGFAALWGDRLWAGYLTLGLLVLALAGGGAAWYAAHGKARRKKAMVAKYEQRKALQRARFGRDVRTAGEA